VVLVLIYVVVVFLPFYPLTLFYMGSARVVEKLPYHHKK